MSLKYEITFEFVNALWSAEIIAENFNDLLEKLKDKPIKKLIKIELLENKE